jgi:hypothetical protein
MKLENLIECATSNRSGRRVSGACLCGAVELEIDLPAFWSWHDHSAASRRAHGTAYATYVGCWRKHARVVKGQRNIARFEDAKTESTRSFCTRCGAPLLYERKRSPHMINILRALFSGRTGREPRYHVAVEELQDWTYTSHRLVPLKGYPDIVWERPKSRRRPRAVDYVDFVDRRLPFAADALALESLALALLYAQYSLAIAATNPLVYVVVMGLMAAFVAYGRYALGPAAWRQAIGKGDTDVGKKASGNSPMPRALALVRGHREIQGERQPFRFRAALMINKRVPQR